MRLTVLGSGSKGNAVLVEHGDSAILIDAGFGCRTLSQRMQAAGCAPERVAALIVTHEHSDHVSGACAAARRWGWPIVASTGTLGALRAMWQDEPVSPRMTALGAHGDTFGALHVTGHAVSHDAADPIALIIEERANGARVGVATDLGHAPATLLSSFAQLDLLVIESNHDPVMLQNGPYPAVLKRRVASRHGHLSNAAAAAFVTACGHRGLRQVVLAHLSETNNTPALALDGMQRALRQHGQARTMVSAAPQRANAGPLEVMACGGARSAAVQLQLLL